ncbi:unnamed protein product [Leptidea sinapis]|nr:unnamed protein product [Leptidea sinapis]
MGSSKLDRQYKL